MTTELFNDALYGTRIVFDGCDEVTVTVAIPFGKLTMALDLDDVDRLLAVVDHAANPAPDLAEFFEYVFHCQRRPAHRAAAAFITAAPGLTETLR